MRWVTWLLVLAIGLFQYNFWVSKGNYQEMLSLEKELAYKQEQNQKLESRNTALAAEVLDLQTGTEAISEVARVDLGYIAEGETFYRFVKN